MSNFDLSIALKGLVDRHSCGLEFTCTDMNAIMDMNLRTIFGFTDFFKPFY